jgi:hypothetical protein
VKQRGFGQHMLYGVPGIGMMEVERPWMESTSTYDLAENMTFRWTPSFMTRTSACAGRRSAG